MRKIALAFACLPVACTAHGRGAQASQVTGASSRVKHPHGRVSSDRRPKDTFGKLMLKQSEQLVSADRKPKETFGKLLLSLSTPATSVPYKSSDPRARSSTHSPTSASSRYTASSRQSSSRQSSSKYSSMGWSSSPEHTQRQSGVDKRKRTTQRTPGKRPGDLPPPRAQTKRPHSADSSTRSSMFQGDFHRLALGTVAVLVLTFVYIFVTQRNGKAAHDTKEGRIGKKHKIGKHKTNAKAQKPVQQQAKPATEAASRSTSKSAQKVVDMPARSTSKNVEHAKKEEVKKVGSRLNVEHVENVSVENVNVEKEEDKKLGARLSSKKARRKVRKADDKHQLVDEQVDQQVEEPADEQSDEQASGSQQFQSSSVVADEQTTGLEMQQLIGAETIDLSSGVANGHTDVEVSELQCSGAGADRNVNSCRVESVALSPDSTVASSGESTDEDSDQVRAEFIKNDENDLLDGQTTTGSSASREVPGPQHHCAASPTSSLAKSVTEDDEFDEERKCVPPCSVAEDKSWTPEAESLQAHDSKEAMGNDQDFAFQPPVAKEPEMEPEMTTEMESKTDGLPPGVSFTGGPSFTDGRQVFTPCVSQDGQQWFTDGKHLYTAMYMPVPLDMNGASSPSTSMPYVEASPNHASGTYQNACWQPPNAVAPGYTTWQPHHAGW